VGSSAFAKAEGKILTGEIRATGEVASAISNAVVHRLSETTGRGPTKARTTFGVDAVFVVLADSMTRGERTLVDHGQGDVVLDLRRRWQMAMRTNVCDDIERLTGREVVGFMSDNHIDPDLAVEVFVLDPLPAEERASLSPEAAEGSEPSRA
jgi:uncharacterized protein YbcI